ncbi:hypothetical protein ACFUGD_01800 [Streptomyces sp. NPDC057217]|uniref:hypothetical protein n=1 Tax=Streptomyces sp. NPDC057217 TaxID=3346054 RepID=UPI003642ECDE
MSTNHSEQQLVEEAKSALLMAIKETAAKHDSTRALNLAQAYAAIATAQGAAPGGLNGGTYEDKRLEGRR